MTDTERLDFIEAYLGREGIIYTDEGDTLNVRTWQVVTAAAGSLRDTLDLMIRQRLKLASS